MRNVTTAAEATGRITVMLSSYVNRKRQNIFRVQDRFYGARDTLMACLHGAIVAAIGRATDRRDRLHVCLHDAIVAAISRAISRATDRATIVWL